MSSPRLGKRRRQEKLTSLPQDILTRIVALIPRRAHADLAELHAALRCAVLAQPLSALRVVDTWPVRGRENRAAAPLSLRIAHSLVRDVRLAGPSLHVLRLHHRLPREVVDQTMSIALRAQKRPVQLHTLAFPGSPRSVAKLRRAAPHLRALRHCEICFPPPEAFALVNAPELKLSTLTFSNTQASDLVDLMVELRCTPGMSSSAAAAATSAGDVKKLIKLRVYISCMDPRDEGFATNLLMELLLHGKELTPRVGDLQIDLVKRSDFGSAFGNIRIRLIDTFTSRVTDAIRSGRQLFPKSLSVFVGDCDAVPHDLSAPVSGGTDGSDVAPPHIVKKSAVTLRPDYFPGAADEAQAVCKIEFESARLLSLERKSFFVPYALHPALRLSDERHKVIDDFFRTAFLDACGTIEAVEVFLNYPEVSQNRLDFLKTTILTALLASASRLQSLILPIGVLLKGWEFPEPVPRRGPNRACSEADSGLGAPLCRILQECGATLKELHITNVVDKDGTLDLLYGVPSFLQGIRAYCGRSLQSIFVTVELWPGVRDSVPREVVRQCDAAIDELEIAMPFVQTSCLRTIVDTVKEMQMDEFGFVEDGNHYGYYENSVP